MKEPLVKFVLTLIAFGSLALGALWLIAPQMYLDYGAIEPTHIGWLRTIGAGLIGLQGFGLLIATVRRRDTNPGLLLIAFATTLQTGSAWFSLVTREFVAEVGWVVVVPIALATVASILLWMAYMSRHASRVLLGAPRGTKGDRAVGHDDAAGYDRADRAADAIRHDAPVGGASHQTADDWADAIRDEPGPSTRE